MPNYRQKAWLADLSTWVTLSNTLTFNKLRCLGIGGMKMKRTESSEFFTGVYLLLNRLDHDAA